MDKKKKKSINAFVELLFNCKQIRSNSSWNEIRDLIKDDPAFYAIQTEEERQALYQDFVTRKQVKLHQQDVISHIHRTKTAPVMKRGE